MPFSWGHSLMPVYKSMLIHATWMDFKNMQSKSKTQKIHKFYFYEILQQTKLTNNNRKHVSGCLGLGVKLGAI